MTFFFSRNCTSQLANLHYILTFSLMEIEFVVCLKGGVVHVYRNMTTEHFFESYCLRNLETGELSDLDNQLFWTRNDSQLTESWGSEFSNVLTYTQPTLGQRRENRYYTGTLFGGNTETQFVIKEIPYLRLTWECSQFSLR